MNNSILISYWIWFLRGSGGRPGYRRLLNRWLFVHLSVGLLLSLIVKVNLYTAANAVLLPLTGILIGLSFAWAGNAQALLQSDEIRKLSKHHEGGFVEYVFIYQTAILIILATLVLWAMAGLHVFDNLWPTQDRSEYYFAIKIILFSFSSMTIRECWHVVSGANWMLQSQMKIKNYKNQKLEEKEGENE